MRHFIILRRQNGNVWVQTTAVRAWNARRAVDTATSGEGNPFPIGDFVAVPLRYWRIQTRR